MVAQPDDRSCGPTCLQAVYRYFGREEPLEALIEEIPQLETGGTLAVQLGCHALRRGFSATIHTYNVQLFDPTWFRGTTTDLRERLAEQARVKPDDGRLGLATTKYLEFLELGGRVEHDMLEPALIHGILAQGLPILTGLSATYLYGHPREVPDEDRPDDIRGEPVGHFVVLSGHDPSTVSVTVADPWPDPEVPDQLHVRPLFRVIAAILLGVLTYDANLLVLRPR
ncbi:MAG: hypothetical protein KDK70_32375 [Myxococcales bacterium]|nr:hypothetical protein [Myxococcales bacterium]